MSLASNATVEKSNTTDNLQQLTLNKCLNDRLQESICFEEIAELISASLSDMSSLSVKPEKCAIIQETVSQIHRIQKQATGERDELQESEVSSSNSSILNSEILGPLLLEALDGFLLLVNTDGKIEVVSENISYFLKYTKDDLVGKSIYNIIHVGDHARFSSNLLPMSIGNGFSWNTEPGISTSKSRTFNCRFLIKALEDPDESMEEKQTRVSHYESMQISTVLLPHPAEHSDNSEAETSDAQNFLFCVARRIPSNEQNQGSSGIEQFTTRLDITGKILAIDTSGVSSTYSQYLNKDLVERIIQGLCDPKDLHKLNQHLKETLQVGSNTSGIYRLRVAPEKYIHVQTRSKRVAYNPLTNEQEFIMATHSIIRDPDFPNVSQRNGTPFVTGSSSPSSSMGTGVYTSTTLNAAVSEPSSSSLYSSLTSLPSSSHEISFDDFGLELFSSPNWEIASGNDREVLTSSSTVPSSSSVTCASSESNVRLTLSVVQQAQLTTSVFSTDTVPVTHSPAPQMTSPSNAGVGRVTPLTTYTYSPLQGPPSSGRATPVLSEVKKVEDELCVISDINSVNRDVPLVPFSEHHTQARNNPKLRNVLAQSVEDRKSSAEATSFSKMFGDNGSSQSNAIGPENGLVIKGTYVVTGDESSNTSSKNVILRELLNQDEDAISEFKPHYSTGDIKSGMSSTGTDSFRNDINKTTSKTPVNNNNMLRKLLNSEVESTRNNRRSQDMLIQQLLKAESPEKVDNSVCGDANSQSSSTDQLLKDLCINSNQSSNSSSLPGSLSEVFSSFSKRKSDDNLDSGFNPPPKRPAVQHPHLAGQNPMLASMLAQTPKTEPSVPTTIANSIMSQLPQDRLPKNLEKKLIQTPCTVTTSSSNSSTQHGTNHTISTNHSMHTQDVVAVDSQGHVAPSHHPVNTLNLNQRQTVQTQPHQHQHQGFLSRILNSSDGSQLTRVLAAASASATSPNQSIQNTYSHYQLPSQVVQQTTKSITLSDLLADVSSFDSVVGLTAQSQTSDPMLSQILDEVWSMQQEMEPSPLDDNMIRKILDEVFEQPTGSSSSGSLPSSNQPVKTVQDVHEKLAISAIQQQLMSYEISAGRTTTTSHVAAPVHTQTSGEALTPNTVVSFSSPNYPSAPSLSTYTSGAQNGLRLRGQNPGTPISVQQCVSLGNVQHPTSGGGFTSSLSPEVYHKLLERRQKMLQHQKRLRAQQQQKQIAAEPLTSASSSAALSENMNDLLNNTVAPNVTLQRFNSVPDQQLPSRYNTNLLGQTNQSQVSPGQQSPYSPLSQHPFPSPNPPVSNSFSQHRLPSYPSSTVPVTGGGPHSPHLQALSSKPQWNQRSAPNSVQHQNPMLNAQLSQNLLNGQGKFVAQPRQIQIRSMPSPNSITNQRSLRFPGPSDSQFQPQSPGHLYQQAPQTPSKQQRMQRAVSVPGALNSPKTPQSGFVGNEQVVSSQAQISPDYTNQPTPGNNYTPTSGTSEVSLFSYDQQSLQMYSSSSVESRGKGTGNSTGGMTSEYVRQELRAMVGAKTQQQQAQSQQLHQYSLSGGNNSGVSAPTSNQQIFNQGELDALVLSLDIGTVGDSSPGSPRLFPSPLGSSVSRVTSHSPRGEEPKPTDHTKSLLQQLLQHTPESC